MGVVEQPLSKKQQELLRCIYNFRFASTDLLTKNLKLKNKSNIRIRLHDLCRLGYISRKYNSSYKFLRKPAVFYLLPKSFPVLRKLDGVSGLSLKNMYKDRHVSERFIHHSLSIYTAYISLKARYYQRLWFFTVNNLKIPSFDYFPRPLPDAFISLKLSDSPRSTRKHFFLLFCSSRIPVFVHLKQLKSLIDYRDSEQWEQTTNTSLSGILVLTDNRLFQNKLIEKMAKLLYNEGLDEDLSYFITTEDKLADISEADSQVGQSISNPTVIRSLERI